MIYDEDYFERGVQLGISGYSDYRWLPDLTIPMCKTLIDHLDIKRGDRVLDYGCAKGFLIRALLCFEIDAHGVDVSEYALTKVDASVLDRVHHIKNHTDVIKLGLFDWIVSKDVLEHVSYADIGPTLETLSKSCKNAFFVVPLGQSGRYVVPEYEHDVTHVIREDTDWWIKTVQDSGLEVTEATHRVPGIKDNWSHYEKGNLFLRARGRHG